jgi:glycosyltransferase involved in cell wall biosynthesis
MQGAQFVAAVTRPLQQQILSATSLSKAVVPVIWMGVDTERFAPTSLDFLGPLKLLTVARLNRQKGHTFALQAIRRCLDEGLEVSYTIVGSGEHRGSIEEEIARLGLEGAVRLMGTLSEDEVLAALQACHVFVLPSVGLGEAAPVSVMEAMACGRAVVCSRIGGTTDMIRDGVDGRIVEQGDVEGLVQAFKQLGQQPELAKQMGAAARQTAVSQFDHRALAQRLALAISGEPARASL